MTIVTRYWDPPNTARYADWTAVTNNYEPGDPIGYGRTEAEATEHLRELLEEQKTIHKPTT